MVPLGGQATLLLASSGMPEFKIHFQKLKMATTGMVWLVNILVKKTKVAHSLSHWRSGKVRLKMGHFLFLAKPPDIFLPWDL